MTNTPTFDWKLASFTFTLADKLRIGHWLLTEDQWTAGEWIERYEHRWEAYTRAPHAIMVSSGSAANELIALRRKWELQQSGEWPRRNRVVFPACTWISSISPWIHVGFEPVFTDIGYNLNATVEQVEAAIKSDDRVVTAFYTTLLGHSCDLPALLAMCRRHRVKLNLDNCEASFSWAQSRRPDGTSQPVHFCNLVPSSTSIYFSHFTTSGTEGGLVFCQTDEENEWYRMMRSHGMTRGMPARYRNPDVEAMFDFHYLGSNYRSSNLQAFMASLDFDRALAFAPERVRLSRAFYEALGDAFDKPHYDPTGGYVPLSLPIVAKSDRGLIHKVRAHLLARGVQLRQIVGGNLCRQTCFKGMADPTSFKRADWVHFNGVYIGLGQDVTLRMVETLGAELAELAEGVKLREAA